MLGIGVALIGGLWWLATPAWAAPTAALQAPLPLAERLLAFLANPNVAYLLFVLGLIGIVAELVTAGTVFPGTLGAICLILALVGLGQLPTNWGGAALILAGIIMLVLDIKVTGYGLTVGGLIAFLLGSVLIYTPFWVSIPPETPGVRLSSWTIIGTTVGVGAFFVLGLSAAIRAQFRPVAMGKQTILGATGTVKQALNPTGIVHLAGEEWSAAAADGSVIPVGAQVRVVAADGLTLRVEPVGE
jgi:membrane-bound serine protease (ClpP class)